MKEFDLEKALAGELVCTRDGRIVTQLHKFDADTERPLYGVVRGAIYSWMPTGRYNHIHSEADLFMDTKKRTVWINVYDDKLWSSFAGLHPTQEKADEISHGHKRVGDRAWPLEIEE